MTVQLSDDDEVLFRQVHPGFMQGDAPSSQVVLATPNTRTSLRLTLSPDNGKDSYGAYTGNVSSRGGVWPDRKERFAQDIPW